MSINYNKLFVMMKEKGLTTYRIRKERIVSEGALQSLRDNKPVNLETILAFCRVLDCQPGELMEYIPEKQ